MYRFIESRSNNGFGIDEGASSNNQKLKDELNELIPKKGTAIVESSVRLQMGTFDSIIVNFVKAQAENLLPPDHLIISDDQIPMTIYKETLNLVNCNETREKSLKERCLMLFIILFNIAREKVYILNGGITVDPYNSAIHLKKIAFLHNGEHNKLVEFFEESLRGLKRVTKKSLSRIGNEMPSSEYFTTKKSMINDAIRRRLDSIKGNERIDLGQVEGDELYNFSNIVCVEWKEELINMVFNIFKFIFTCNVRSGNLYDTDAYIHIINMYLPIANGDALRSRDEDKADVIIALFLENARKDHVQDIDISLDIQKNTILVNFIRNKASELRIFVSPEAVCFDLPNSLYDEVEDFINENMTPAKNNKDKFAIQSIIMFNIVKYRLYNRNEMNIDPYDIKIWFNKVLFFANDQITEILININECLSSKRILEQDDMDILVRCLPGSGYIGLTVQRMKFFTGNKKGQLPNTIPTDIDDHLMNTAKGICVDCEIPGMVKLVHNILRYTVMGDYSVYMTNINDIIKSIPAERTRTDAEQVEYIAKRLNVNYSDVTFEKKINKLLLITHPDKNANNEDFIQARNARYTEILIKIKDRLRQQQPDNYGK
jgi:hypothetical protein